MDPLVTGLANGLKVQYVMGAPLRDRDDMVRVKFCIPMRATLVPALLVGVVVPAIDLLAPLVPI